MNDSNIPKTKKGIEAKEKIFNNSLNLFKTKGYENTTLTDICYESNIANGTFYHYFKSKQDICVEYLRQENEKLYNYYNSLSINSYAEALLKILNRQLDSCGRVGQEFYNTVFISELSSKQQAFQLTEGNLLGKIIVDCIRKGQESNEFSQNNSSEYLSTLFIGQITLHTLKWCSSIDDYDIKTTLIPDLKLLIESLLNNKV